MNRKVSPSQAKDISRLVNTERLKLREVQEQFPVLSLTQIHRISTGKNWGQTTGDSAKIESGKQQNQTASYKALAFYFQKY